MSQALLASPLVSIAIFLVIFVSDSLLTVHAVRLYKAGADRLIALEGGYELNPVWAKDVDRLRALPPRFVAGLALYSLLIWALWYLSVGLSWFPRGYAFFAGAILLVQGPIHMRHIRNIVVFRHAKNQEGIQGRIQYTRRFSYKVSAVELLAFSTLYLVLAFLSESLLLLGGAFGTAVLAFRSYQASRKISSQPGRE